MFTLQPFQSRFLKAAFRSRIAALSVPRGNGKSTLCAHVCHRALTPGDPLFVGRAREVLVVSASIEQSRAIFNPLREWLEGDGSYRFTDSQRALSILHKPTRARLRVMASSGRTAMGIVRVPLLIADEPGAWKPNDGQLLYEAITSATAKPGSLLRVVMIGTIWPAPAGSFWPRLLAGGTDKETGRYVQHLAGKADKWRQWREVLRCNPLVASDPEARDRLRQLWTDAKRDSADKATFLSAHMNMPSGDEARMLLSIDDWQAALARPVAAPDGKPVFGIDLGANRAWSAAVAIWPSGRTEAIAYAPGIPDIGEQERRDRVPANTYARLVDGGQLLIADGLHKPEARHLLGEAVYRFGQPSRIVCDFFQLDDLRNAAGGLAGRIVPRRTRWSESTADIKALQALVRDGGLSVDAASRAILTASLAAAETRHDDGGSIRLVKRGFNNTSRDDVAAALVLAAGELKRQLDAPRRTTTWSYA